MTKSSLVVLVSSIGLVACAQHSYRPVSSGLTERQFYQASNECQQYANSVRRSEMDRINQEALSYSDSIAQSMYRSTAGLGASASADNAYRTCMASKGWIPE